MLHETNPPLFMYVSNTLVLVRHTTKIPKYTYINILNTVYSTINARLNRFEDSIEQHTQVAIAGESRLLSGHKQ